MYKNYIQSIEGIIKYLRFHIPRQLIDPVSKELVSRNYGHFYRYQNNWWKKSIRSIFGFNNNSS